MHAAFCCNSVEAYGPWYRCADVFLFALWARSQPSGRCQSKFQDTFSVNMQVMFSKLCWLLNTLTPNCHHILGNIPAFTNTWQKLFCLLELLKKLNEQKYKNIWRGSLGLLYFADITRSGPALGTVWLWHEKINMHRVGLPTCHFSALEFAPGTVKIQVAHVKVSSVSSLCYHILLSFLVHTYADLARKCHCCWAARGFPCFLLPSPLCPIKQREVAWRKETRCTQCSSINGKGDWDDSVPPP